jgi:phosphoribosyl-dephospho-CoA transferase
LAGDTPAVDRWHAEGNPFVVCRQRGGQDLLSLGFCLATPGQRPRRVAVHAGHDQILRTARPPALTELPPPFASLSDAAVDADLDVRVFGSWMWQTLTGAPHVTEASDLDVLIDVSTAAEADRAATFLEAASEDSLFRVDGELSIPGLGEVHWREYLNRTPELLLKSLVTVRMIRRGDLWE